MRSSPTWGWNRGRPCASTPPTVASQTETVNVQASADAVITTDTSGIANAKQGKELLDLPIAIASRGAGSTSPISTLTTQAGVQTDSSGNLSVAGAKAQHVIGLGGRHQQREPAQRARRLRSCFPASAPSRKFA